MNANYSFPARPFFAAQFVAVFLLPLSLTFSISAQEPSEAKPQPRRASGQDQRLEQIHKQIQELKKAVDDLLQTPTSAPRRADTDVRPGGDAATKQPIASASSARRNTNDPIVRIREEGLNRSQVMQTLSYLTDVIGPRLTGSPNLKRANGWTRDKLAS
jgi:hypothetical protein